jgi:phenylacetate-coenzyme A ligase PaaK-like adenylate-forming protein
MHVTSGTMGTPVAIGLTRADHQRNSAVGARRSGSPACAVTTSWRTA